MADTLKLIRGLFADLPNLAIGEPALATDSEQVFIGVSSGIKQINSDALIKVYEYSPMVLSTNNYIFTLHTTGNGDKSYAAIRFYDGGTNQYREIQVILRNMSGSNILDVIPLISSGITNVQVEIRYMNRVADTATTDFFITCTGTIGSGQFVEVQSKELLFDSANAEETTLTNVTLNTNLHIAASGNVGIKLVNPSVELDVNGDIQSSGTVKTDTIAEKTGGAGVTIDGVLLKDGYVHIPNHTPSSATDTGAAGQICRDSSYFYICIATNTWRRIAHNTWA